MDVSVIIPTRGRPEKAAACVTALAGQTLEQERYEVLIGLDGADPETGRSVAEAWSPAAGVLRVITCPRDGYNAARNRLLPLCQGQTLISLNDDVRPGPAFLATHVREQQRAAVSERPAIIVGRSPWVRSEPDRLFDRLIRETSMVFFYDQMTDADPDRDWGFRHAWGLNISMPTAAAIGVGGWTAFPMEYGYDDIEIAWRLQDRLGLPVLYRPQAVAPHDHRLEPRAYLEREFRLGRSAWLFARRNPGFARDVFGRDITSHDELAYSHAFVKRERAAAAQVLESFGRLADIPSDVVDGPHARTLLTMVYQQHLLLKRWMWRAGLVAAAQRRPVGDVSWPADEG